MKAIVEAMKQSSYEPKAISTAYSMLPEGIDFALLPGDCENFNLMVESVAVSEEGEEEPCLGGSGDEGSSVHSINDHSVSLCNAGPVHSENANTFSGQLQVETSFDAHADQELAALVSPTESELVLPQTNEEDALSDPEMAQSGRCSSFPGQLGNQPALILGTTPLVSPMSQPAESDLVVLDSLIGDMKSQLDFKRESCKQTDSLRSEIKSLEGEPFADQEDNDRVAKLNHLNDSLEKVETAMQNREGACSCTWATSDHKQTGS